MKPVMRGGDLLPRGAQPGHQGAQVKKLRGPWGLGAGLESKPILSPSTSPSLNIQRFRNFIQPGPSCTQQAGGPSTHTAEPMSKELGQPSQCHTCRSPHCPLRLSAPRDTVGTLARPATPALHPSAPAPGQHWCF